MATDLDDVDRGILHALQANARDVTVSEMAETVGVAASTVRNRIDRLERERVIRGYRAEVDYERAGFPLHAVVRCRAPADGDLVDRIMDLPGTVGVREVLSNAENLHVEVAAADAATVDGLVGDLTDLGVEVTRTDLVTNHTVQPFARFDCDRRGEH